MNHRMNSTPAFPVACASRLGDRLIGWKAIGRYLGCTARTARRWEIARGLPVHRLTGGGRGSVWCTPDELQRWLESKTRGGGVVQPVAPVGTAGAPVESASRGGGYDAPPDAVRVDTRAPWLLVAIALLLMVLSAAGFQWNS